VGSAATDETARASRLSGDQIHVWVASLQVASGIFAALSRTLSADELERAGRFRFERDRRRFVVARGMMRDLLGRYAQVAPATVKLSYSEFGKPALAGPTALRFNLSHSGEMAVLAIARGREVGVDVEEFAPARADTSVAANFFSCDELRRLNALPREQRPQGFFNCWTRKEAYIKARGQGLSIALDSFDVTLRPGEPAAILRETEAVEVGCWRLCALELGGGYVGALAAAGRDWVHRLCRWSPG
jgi:4'-phosphopantetheinyl transferase